MIDITNSFSLTDFQRNAKEFLEFLNRDRKPILLTVNGRVQAVVIDPTTFQIFMDDLSEAARAERRGTESDVRDGR